MESEADLTRWEIMEQWLITWVNENGHAPFSANELASSIGITTPEASGLIQAYQQEQSNLDPRSSFVIKRQGRTRAAFWSVGNRKRDVKQINLTFVEDMEVKAKRAFAPALHRIAVLNPKEAKEIERILDGTLEGAFLVMRSALGL